MYIFVDPNTGTVNEVNRDSFIVEVQDDERIPSNEMLLEAADYPGFVIIPVLESLRHLEGMDAPSDKPEELLDHRVITDTRQSKWRIRRTFAWRGHKIRVTVDNDPYEFQCDYYAEVLDPSSVKWNRVHTETTAWEKQVGALSSSKADMAAVGRLMNHMLSVAQDLLA